MSSKEENTAKSSFACKVGSESSALPAVVSEETSPLMGPTYDPLNRRCLFIGPLGACSLGALAFGVLLPCAAAQWPTAPRMVAAVSASAVAAAKPLPDSPGFLQAATTEAPARIAGTVYDINGGLVPGATITVLDKAGITVGTGTTDSEAHFEVRGLPPGSYKVRIAATGLESFESPVVVLKPGELHNLPQTALPIASTNETVNVVLTQEMIADQEIADETKQRVLGIFPNFYTSYEWNAAPLNAKQKFKVAFRSTTDPLQFVTTAIIAGVQQARGTYTEDYGGGVEGYADRFGAQYGNAVIGRFIGGAILPSIFHQDPRYFYMGPPSTTGQRFRHAVAFSVTARSDRGHDGHLVPNYSHILGNFIAGYISRTYHPSSDNGISLAVDNALIGIGAGAVQGLTREFLFRGISSHTPKYAKGKPVGVDPVEDKPAIKSKTTTPPAPATTPAPANPATSKS